MNFEKLSLEKFKSQSIEQSSDIKVITGGDNINDTAVVTAHPARPQSTDLDYEDDTDMMKAMFGDQ